MSLWIYLETETKTVADFQKKLDYVAGNFKYTASHEENQSTIQLCRLGFITFTYQEEKKKKLMLFRNFKVTAEAQSNIAGPGLHKAIVDFIDELQQICKQKFHVNDETEYYDTRDFSALKTAFYNWFKSVLRLVEEEKQKGELESLMICWDLNKYYPEEIKGTVVSPWGRINPEVVLPLIESVGVESIAKELIIWSEEEKDARFYRNSALNALWEDCYFMPSSRSETDYAINGEIIDCLEKAIALDPTLPIPKKEYVELCKLHGTEPMDISALTDFECNYPIGYRKEWIRTTIGELRFPLPGNDLYVYDENDHVNVWYDTNEEDWHNAFRVSAYRYDGNEDTLTHKGALLQKGSFNYGNYSLYYLGKEGEGETSYEVSQIYIVTSKQFTFITVSSPTYEENLFYANKIIKGISSWREDDEEEEEENASEGAAYI